ncbi:MAG: alpha/beta hydrolase-fold protein [Ruminococcus sp.]|nr:alpha/beta hydrolase-fold protein [Ruminococcus sp.]
MQIVTDRYEITCYLPENGRKDRVVYLHTAAGKAQDIWRLTAQDFVMVSIAGLDWNRDLSPWRHAKVFAKGEDFAGGADDYLQVLTGRLIPETESAFLLSPVKRYLAGYSLAGLFAVYALYQTAVFDGIASVSGSLWYEGFMDYVQKHNVRRNPDKIYFSLGDKEAASARGIMQSVFVCTKQIADKFRADGIPTELEMNPGKHFYQVPERMARGLYRLLLEKGRE